MSIFERRFRGWASTVTATAALVFLMSTPRPVAAQFLHGCDQDARMFFININTGAGTFICNLPTFPDPGATEIEFDFFTLRGILQTRDGIFTYQLVDIFNCAPITPQVFNGFAFNGMEFINGVLYGTVVSNQCGASELRILNTSNGSSTLIGPTGLGPVSGLAYDWVHGILYGVTGHCATGVSELVIIDINTGAATVVGPTGVKLGSLEFGPDGRLYAGGGLPDGGNFYSIELATGLASLIGPTGFNSVSGLAFAQFPLPIEDVTWGEIKEIYKEGAKKE